MPLQYLKAIKSKKTFFLCLNIIFDYKGLNFKTIELQELQEPAFDN